MKSILNLGYGLRVTTLLITTSLAFGAQADSGRTLTELLVEKGVITESEAASVGRQAPDGLIELLVAKGVISADDAAMLEGAPRVAQAPQPSEQASPATRGSSSREIVKAKDKAVETLTISGRIQAQWDLLSTQYENAEDPRGENNIFMRRIYLGVGAQFADGVSGTFVTDFGTNAAGSGETEKAIIDIDLSDHHLLTVGYQKVPFGYEETTSSTKLLAIERSVATRYFTEQLELGSRHTGIYLNGEYDSGIYFSVAATNPRAFSVSASSDTDRLAFWGQAGWSGDVGRGSLNVGLAGGHIPGSRDLRYDDRVYNLYANVNLGSFALMTEILGGVIEGARADGSDAKPLGFNILPSWKFNDKWELVGRYAYLESDEGIGVDISTGVRRSAENESALYDSVEAYYIGGNWYIRGNSLKLTAGYGWGSFKDNLTGTQGNADVQGFRTRLQLLF